MIAGASPSVPSRAAAAAGPSWPGLDRPFPEARPHHASKLPHLEARRGGAISSSIGAAADPTGLRFGCLSPSQKGHAPARVRRAHADPIVSAVDTLCGGTSRQVMKSPRPRTCTAPVHTARVSTAPRTADLPPTVPGHAALVSRLRRPAGRGDRPVSDTDGRRDAGHTRVAACLHWDLAGVRRKVGRVACLLVDPSRSATSALLCFHCART